MKVQELRELMEHADRKNLEKAFAESYKCLPKAKKEEIDPLICDILNGNEKPKAAKGTTMPFEKLEAQINTFLENAYAQNYFAPNRIIPKSQRPKWRFLVKNFIKELEKVPVESEYFSRSVSLLTELYKMLCEACNYYLFSTDDAFRSVGWEQPKLFKLVVKRTFSIGYSQENIKNLLLLATTGGLSRESLPAEMEFCLLAELHTSDVKYTAIEKAKELIEEQKRTSLKKGLSDSLVYDLKWAINELCAMILMLSVSLGEPEDGVRFYFQNCREHNMEVVLYCALQIAEWMDEDQVWLDIYRYGLKKKISPRESLREKYQQLMEKNGSL